MSDYSYVPVILAHNLPEQAPGLPACTCFWRRCTPNLNESLPPCVACSRLHLNLHGLRRKPNASPYEATGDMIGYAKAVLSLNPTHLVMVFGKSRSPADLPWIMACTGPSKHSLVVLQQKPEWIAACLAAHPTLVKKVLDDFVVLAVRPTITSTQLLTAVLISKFNAFVDTYPGTGYTKIKL